MKISVLKSVKACFVFAFAMVILASCNREDSADVNQERIYTLYEVFYNENDDVTHAIARFRFGSRTGTLLELTGDAGVTFNGEPMPYSVLWSGHHISFAGKVNGGTFEYTNVDGEEFTNTVGAYGEIAFPDDFNELNKNQAYDLVWDGDPLGQNEHVGIFIGTWTWGDDALFLQSADNADNIIMGVNGLSNLAVGQATVYMDRWTERNASDNPGAGGKIIGKHRAQNVSVNVIE